MGEGGGRVGGKGVEGEEALPKLALNFRLSKTEPNRNRVSDRDNRSRGNRKAYPGRFLVGLDYSLYIASFKGKRFFWWG